MSTKSVNQIIHSDERYNRLPVFSLSKQNIRLPNSSDIECNMVHIKDCEFNSNFYNISFNNNVLTWLRRVKLSINDVVSKAFPGQYTPKDIYNNDGNERWHLCKLYIDPNMYGSVNEIVENINNCLANSIKSLFGFKVEKRYVYENIMLNYYSNLLNDNGVMCIDNAVVANPLLDDNDMAIPYICCGRVETLTTIAQDGNITKDASTDKNIYFTNIEGSNISSATIINPRFNSERFNFYIDNESNYHIFASSLNGNDKLNETNSLMEFKLNDCMCSYQFDSTSLPLDKTIANGLFKTFTSYYDIDNRPRMITYSSCILELHFNKVNNIWILNSKSNIRIIENGTNFVYYAKILSNVRDDNVITIEKEGSTSSDIIQITYSSYNELIESESSKIVIIKFAQGPNLELSSTNYSSVYDVTFTNTSGGTLYNYIMFKAADDSNKQRLSFGSYDNVNNTFTRLKTCMRLYTKPITVTISSGDVISGDLYNFKRNISLLKLFNDRSSVEFEKEIYTPTSNFELFYDEYFNTLRQNILMNKDTFVVNEVNNKLVLNSTVDILPININNYYKKNIDSYVDLNKKVNLEDKYYTANLSYDSNISDELYAFNNETIDDYYYYFLSDDNIWNKLGFKTCDIVYNTLYVEKIDNDPKYIIKGKYYSEELYTGPILTSQPYEIVINNKGSANRLPKHIHLRDGTNIKELDENILNYFVNKEHYADNMSNIMVPMNVYVCLSQDDDIEQKINNGNVDYDVLSRFSLINNNSPCYLGMRYRFDINRTIEIPNNSNIYVYIISPTQPYMIMDNNSTLNVEYYRNE